MPGRTRCSHSEKRATTRTSARSSYPGTEKQRNPRAYKAGPPINSTVGACISDAFGAIEELAGECRDNADNTEGKPQHDAWDEAANTLENVSAPDVPAFAEELPATYVEQVNKDKRRGPSRAVRLSNAVSMLEAAKEVLDSMPEDDGEEAKQNKEAAEQLSSDLDEAIDLDGSVDFPGMYGS